MMSQPAVQKDAIMIYEIDYFVIKAARWTTKSVVSALDKFSCTLNKYPVIHFT